MSSQVRSISRPRSGHRGQSMVEYVTISAAFLGATTIGWPFLVELLNALNRYFGSIYYVIQSPLP
ncbi:hypothetical protein POL68_25275 [Stigmatella sp. ncwal1]|uniref:Flp family type IVb pilin n=1 Tax=Stigmatella ashevillensis TaxID=2995309 RepID=A0ABT5DDT6_9BACT|nr:hypothetical protein [Stigmatella ashevillena]MDC0711806.1 hypothetical protein [Stigmatella ashevillena]